MVCNTALHFFIVSHGCASLDTIVQSCSLKKVLIFLTCWIPPFFFLFLQCFCSKTWAVELPTVWILLIDFLNLVCPVYFLQIGRWIQRLDQSQVWSLWQDYTWWCDLPSGSICCLFLWYQQPLMLTVLDLLIHLQLVAKWSYSIIPLSFTSWNIFIKR